MSAFSRSEPTETSAEAELATKRRWLHSQAEIAIRIGALVVMGSLVAAWGMWEALRVLSDID